MKTDDKTESACVASAANIHDPRAVRLWAEDSIPRPAGHAGAVEGRHGAAYPVATTGTCWSKRRAWDSNPRWVLPHSGFQDRRHRPLGEPSWRRQASAPVSGSSSRPRPLDDGAEGSSLLGRLAGVRNHRM